MVRLLPRLPLLPPRSRPLSKFESGRPRAAPGGPEPRSSGDISLSARPEPRAVKLVPPDHRRPSPKDSLIEALVISILAVAAVVLIAMQVLYRRRVMRRRQAAGQDPVGRGTYVIFAVTAAFFLFAVFVFPLLVRGN